VKSTRSLKKDWILTQEAFDSLLARLDADRHLAGEKYELLRLKLIKFFEWQDSLAPEELADETINRVSRKIAEGETIQNLNGYIFGAARHLASESRKRMSRAESAREHLTNVGQSNQLDEMFLSRLECCETCLSRLTEDKHELITAYYAFEKGSKIDAHKRMADAFGISLNSLRIRAHRIKLELERCIVECEKKREK
jgi:DNA-directed RNA polymerase specialized sigma24 family protein